MKDYRYLYGMPESSLNKQAAFKEDLCNYFKKVCAGSRPFQKTAKEKRAIVRGLLNKVATDNKPAVKPAAVRPAPPAGAQVNAYNGSNLQSPQPVQQTQKPGWLARLRNAFWRKTEQAAKPVVTGQRKGTSSATAGSWRRELE